MSGAFFLGWRYLAFHRLKTAILVASITLMLFLPAAIRLLVNDSADALTSRAEKTPLVVGASGSPLELVLSSLYFHAEQPPSLPFTSFVELRDIGLADAIPLNTRFNSRGSPIVGTSLDYFDFRGLSLAQGRMMGMLGECVIGANVAAAHSIAAGDSLVSSPETVFDIAGVYPLKMNITGVLAPSGSADDDAIFVDYKTTWVIQGLGHGHQDLAKPAASPGVLNRKEGMVTANASVVQYAEITPENVSEFHFHGASGDFPLNSVIVVPPDDKSNALLRGRYQDTDQGLQMIVPSSVLNKLLDTVFAVQNYIILGLAILSLATIAVITLVFLLSQQLRRGEFHTLSRIGASKAYIAMLVASEISFVFIGSLLLAAGLTLVVRQYALQILQSVLSL
jgi:putative ABC transport system permease protein